MKSATQATPLTSVALETDLDAPLDPNDPGTGGGFETTLTFQTRLTSPAKVAACGSAIETAASAWATSQQLTRPFREVATTTLTLQYAKSGLGGFFEVTYRLQAGVRARVRVDFYSLDGTVMDPSAIKTLASDYGVNALQDAMDKAIQCGAA